MFIVQKVAHNNVVVYDTTDGVLELVPVPEFHKYMCDNGTKTIESNGIYFLEAPDVFGYTTFSTDKGGDGVSMVRAVKYASRFDLVYKDNTSGIVRVLNKLYIQSDSRKAIEGSIRYQDDKLCLYVSVDVAHSRRYYQVHTDGGVVSIPDLKRSGVLYQDDDRLIELLKESLETNFLTPFLSLEQKKEIIVKYGLGGI